MYRPIISSLGCMDI